MEVPSESFHRSSWDSRTCYPRRAFNQRLTDDSPVDQVLVIAELTVGQLPPHSFFLFPFQSKEKEQEAVGEVVGQPFMGLSLGLSSFPLTTGPKRKRKVISR